MRSSLSKVPVPQSIKDSYVTVSECKICAIFVQKMCDTLFIPEILSQLYYSTFFSDICTLVWPLPLI